MIIPEARMCVTAGIRRAGQGVITGSRAAGRNTGQQGAGLAAGGKDMSGRKGIDPVVRKETLRVGAIAYAGIALMLLGFFLLNRFCPPEVWDVPFDYTVILGGVCCGVIDILNFFLMGLAVVKVTSLEPAVDEEGNVSEEDTGRARKIMSTSMRLRFLMMIVWVVIAIAVPCFNPVAGIMPLLFPTLGIKLLGIANKA